MKKLIFTVLMFFGLMISGQKAPNILKTEFPEGILKHQLTDLNGDKVSIKNILESYKGEILIIDFWASWCQDCVKALPQTKELLNDYPDVKLVYFSLDRSEERWKAGLIKYDILEKQKYWFEEGWSTVLKNQLDLNWIPRFILVDQKGIIANYYAISPEDTNFLKKLKKLHSN